MLPVLAIIIERGWNKEINGFMTQEDIFDNKVKPLLLSSSDTKILRFSVAANFFLLKWYISNVLIIY